MSELKHQQQHKSITLSNTFRFQFPCGCLLGMGMMRGMAGLMERWDVHVIARQSPPSHIDTKTQLSAIPRIDWLIGWFIDGCMHLYAQRSAKFLFQGCVYFCLALPGWCLANQRDFLAALCNTTNWSLPLCFLINVSFCHNQFFSSYIIPIQIQI